MAEIRWVDRFGRRQRTSRRAATKAEATRKLRELRRLAAGDMAPGDHAATVASYWQTWSRGGLRSGSRKASTVDTYVTVMERHVLPAIGGVRLRTLMPGDVEHTMGSMRRLRSTPTGAKGDPVSDQTRRTAYAVLSLMLDAAVRDRIVSRNVCRDVERPKVETVEADYLDRDELRAVLAAMQGHRIEPLILLLATTGLRIGEALALRWEDVEDGSVRVTGTLRGAGSTATRTAPKSARSRRTLPLSPTVVAALRAWKAQQSAERLRAGGTWGDWVFTTETGQVLDARNASRQYGRALRAAGLDTPARFHLLRHTAASLMLADGRVSLRTAAEIMGHGSTRLTSDLYGHVYDDSKRQALDVIGEALA